MIKKSMDIVDLNAWVTTNKNKLDKCYVDNVYKSKNYWILKLRCMGEIKLLKIEPGCRIHLSRIEPQEKEVDNFARFLRAHVRDTRIESIEMPWWERIVVLTTARGDKTLVHYVELVPRGLWVIVSSDNKILYASQFREFKDRVIKPGVTYTPPPTRGIKPGDENTLLEALKTGKDLVRGIVYGWGLPGYIAEELIYRAGLYSERGKKPSEIPQIDLEKLVKIYSDLVSESTQGKGYLVLSDEEKPELFTPYKPLLFIEVYTKETREFDNLDEPIDMYFAEYEAALDAEEEKKRREAELESWRRKIEEQNKIIEEYQKELDITRNMLAAIYENYNEISQVLECTRRIIKEKGWEGVKECKVSGFNPHNGTVVITIGNIDLALSVREPLEKQIVELEKKRGVLEKKIEKAREVLEDLLLKSRSMEEELSRVVVSKKAPVYWYERYRWSITRNGFLVIAGRDASQNEAIIRKYLGDEDVFLHADVHGAAATILLKQRREPSYEDLVDAAYIAGAYSRAWKAGFGYVDVFYVKGSQVSKTPPSGEYLARGSFMIYGEKLYMRVPLALGVGIRLFCDSVYGEYYKVFVGSPELVKSTSIVYAVITPGDKEPLAITKELKRILVDKLREVLGFEIQVSEEQLLQVIPGPSRITEAGKGEGTSKCED